MIGYFDSDLGRVQIAPTIVRNFIHKEVERSRYFRFPGAKPNEPVPRKILERNIRVTFKEGNLEATLILDVRYGTRIIKEARELQGKITRALQLGAGLKVLNIAINVESVFADEPDDTFLIEPNTLHENAVNQ